MNSQSRYVKWRIYKANRRLRRVFYSRLYQDTNHDISKSILISGTARSGTTWLADILSAQLNGRIMFEPFHSKNVKAFSGFQYYHYMRPAEQNEELASYCRNIFTGTARDPWIDQQVESFNPEVRIVKAVRANLFLKWIQNEFPEVPQLIIIRHPCAVASSWMKLNWTAENDLDYFLAQPKLVEDFLLDKMEVIERIRYLEERVAAIWCINNLIPFEQFKDDQLHVVYYEDLCLSPENVVAELFSVLDRPYQEDLASLLRKPSTTSHSSSAFSSRRNMVERWRTDLDIEQIRRVEAVVSAFGQDGIYGDASVPQIKANLLK